MLKIVANDPEVGIGRWEYSIGTSPGEDDVIGWSLLQGQQQDEENGTEQSISGPALSFVLEPGTPYYISARVENTMGQLSQVRALQTPVIFDDSPPSYITYNREMISTEQPQSSVRRTYSPITELQPYQGSTETYQSWSDESDQWLHFRNIEAFAADPYSEEGRSPDALQNYSGISRFEYALSGYQNMSVQQFEQLSEPFQGSELIIENPEIGRAHV